MTRSKPISMKKLYQWASDYAQKVIVYDKKKGDEPEKYEEYKLLIGFLKYIWEVRND